MLAKKIFSLSRNLSSLTSLSQFNVIYQCQRYEHFKANQTLNQNVNNIDTFNDKRIATPHFPQCLQTLLEAKKVDVSGDNIVLVLKDMWNFYIKNGLRFEQLRDQSHFKDLCTVINENVTKFNATEVLCIMDMLLKFRIPINSEIFSSLLYQAASLDLDFPTINEFIVLSKILSKIEPTSLTHKISTNLNKKFVIKLNADFEKHNERFLADALYYATENVPSERVVFPIVDALKECKFDKISTNQAVSIVRSISILDKIQTTWKEVLHQTQNKLILDANDIRKQDVPILLNLLSKKTVDDRIPQFYNSKLFDKLAKRILKEEFNFDDGSTCLSYFNKVCHVNKSLVSYLTAVFYEEYEVSQTKKFYNFNKLLILLKGLSYMSYKPIFWDSILKYFRNRKIFNSSAETQLVYCFHLASMGCYDSLVLEKVFKTDYSGLSFKTQYTYLRLWQTLQVLPNYDGPQPPSEALQQFEKLLNNQTKDIVLSCGLEKALNGRKYLKKNLQSKLLHQLDHVLVYNNNQEDPTPQVIDQDVKYIEDLNVPDDCKIVILLSLPESLFGRNTGELLGPYSVCNDYLRSQSYEVVAVPWGAFNSIQIESGINDLLSKIKSKLNGSTTSEVN